MTNPSLSSQKLFWLISQSNPFHIPSQAWTAVACSERRAQHEHNLYQQAGDFILQLTWKICGFIVLSSCAALLAASPNNFFPIFCIQTRLASLNSFPPCNPRRIPLIISNQLLVFGSTASFLLRPLSADWERPPLSLSSALQFLPAAKPQTLIAQHSSKRTWEASHSRTWR